MPGGYSDAVRQVTDRDFDGWSIGLNFGVPLQNRSAKAQSVIADLALDQGRAELEDLMLAVSTEVRRSARAVRTAAQQIDSAGKSRELAVKNVPACIAAPRPRVKLAYMAQRPISGLAGAP